MSANGYAIAVLSLSESSKGEATLCWRQMVEGPKKLSHAQLANTPGVSEVFLDTSHKIIPELS